MSAPGLSLDSSVIGYWMLYPQMLAFEDGGGGITGFFLTGHVGIFARQQEVKDMVVALNAGLLVGDTRFL